VNKLAAVLVAAVLVGTLASAGTSSPLANPTFEDNSHGWFTTSNLEAYGDDLDRRIGDNDSGVIFTGHPAYVIESDEARLLFDMPRAHYFAISWNGTAVGNELYANITAAIRDGRAEWAIDNTMTDTMLESNATLRAAYETHYCRVDDRQTARLYAQTDATLLRWVPNQSACPAGQRPEI